jgi:AcrR family transcriptional regulator
MSMPRAAGCEPKRKRGHLRVAAILAASSEVFAAKGFDAATMTEIAANSGTAIASLYRFFPTKETLADALLRRYAEYALEALGQLRGRAAAMTAAELAGALIAFRLALQDRRKFAAGLADTRGVDTRLRREFRAALRRAMTEVLQAALPALPRAQSEMMAAMLLQLLKGVPAIEEEPPALRRRLLAEMKQMIAQYISAAPRIAAENQS